MAKRLYQCEKCNFVHKRIDPFDVVNLKDPEWTVWPCPSCKNLYARYIEKVG